MVTAERARAANGGFDVGNTSLARAREKNAQRLFNIQCSINIDLDRLPRPKPGAWDSLLLIVKEILPPDSDSQDYAFWVEIEEGAKFSPQEACKQFFDAGYWHSKLARRVINNFPSARVIMDSEKQDQKETLISLLSDKLYDYYPEEYKAIAQR